MLGGWRYVDFSRKTGDRFSKWTRHDLSRLIAREEGLAKTPDVFTTVQLYERSTHKEGERHLCPLYFDFDGDLQDSLADAQTVTLHLTVELGVPEQAVVCKASGSRGFHVIVNPSVLGIKPSIHCTAAVKSAALDLKSELRLTTLDDKVYSIRRMLRIPNSVRAKGSPSLVVPVEKFLEMETWTGEDAAPPPSLRPFDWVQMPVATDAAIWFAGHQDRVEMDAELAGTGSQGFIKKSSGPGDMPVCVKGLLEPRLRSPGTRNSATFLLAVAMREMGWTKQTVLEGLSNWTRNVHTSETGQEAPRHVLKNCHSSVGSAFSGDRKPICAALLGLGSAQDRVPCQGNRCPGVKFQEQKDFVPPEVPLDDLVRPERLGRRALVKCSIVRQDSAPYVLPAMIELSCSEPCAHCPNTKKPTEVQLDGRPKLNMQMASELSEAAAIQRAIKEARRIAGVPSDCNPCTPTIKRSSTLLYTAVQPIIEGWNGGAFRENECYIAVPHVEQQSQYELEVVPVSHPKTMKSVLYSKKATRISRAHDDFEVTSDVRESFEPFRCSETIDGVSKKLAGLHGSYENLHGILGRQMESLGLSLVWHSVLAFSFRGRAIQRGWLEVLAVGDTAQGKSEIARRLLDWYGVGDLLSGESVTTAGLTAGVEQLGHRNMQRLGALPRADRTLTVIDEFHEMKEDVVRSMSEVRSRGFVRMEKIASASAPARVRKIFIANPISIRGRSMAMANFRHPIEAAMNVMRSPEDTRRLDYVVGFASRPELTSKMNQVMDVGCDIDQEAAANLVLWAWSRAPEQVLFSRETELLILKDAEFLSREYECSIPLLDPGETKIKLARIAAAIAAQGFSSPDGQTLHVLECHAEAAKKFLQSLYESDDLLFKAFALEEQKRERMEEEEALELSTALIRACGVGDSKPSDWIAVLDRLYDAHGIGYTVDDIYRSTKVQINGAHQIIETLSMARCLAKARGQGFILTKKGKKFCRILDRWKPLQNGIMGHVPMTDEQDELPF